MKKKHMSAGDRKLAASEEGTRWHRAVLDTINLWISENGWAADPVTERIIRKRLKTLETFAASVNNWRSIYEQIPFAYDDAAALIIWPRPAAMRLARKIFSKTHVDLYEDLPINMNWFYRKLDV